MIDNKKCYFFGRNKQLCDFCIDHQSCSRVHAALVWHKHLSRPFIIDLGSSKYMYYVPDGLILTQSTWYCDVWHTVASQILYTCTHLRVIRKFFLCMHV